MSGIYIDLEIHGLDTVITKMNAVADMQIDDLLDPIGGLLESSTRTRLDETKIAPDGTPWADWSDGYKKNRHSGHSLLDSDGNLIDSITYILGSGEVSVGSPLVYAAAHQFGYEEGGIPARPYLGVSDDDEADINELVNDFISEVMS